MPRARIATSMLDGAGRGLSRLAGAIMGADGAYQQGYQQEAGTQTQIARALAQIDASRAQADHEAAKAEGERAKTAVLQGRPDLFEEQVALASGSSIPLVRAIREATKTGKQAMQPGVQLDGPTQDGEPLGAMATPEQTSAVARALQRLVPMVTNTGDLKIDDWAKAQGAYRDMDLGDDVLAGKRTAGAVGAAQAAVAGKPLYNSDASGAVLDLFGGALATDNPMAQGTIALKGAQTKAQQANAVQSYASAGASNAQRDRTRQEIEQGKLPKPPDFKDVTSLRKEFEDRAEVKNVRQAMPVLAAAKNAPNNTQGDLQLIYAVGKVLDPNSVVREGEMDLVIKSGSPEERLQGFVGYLRGGGRISPQARQKLIKALEARTDEYRREYEQVRKNYAGLAKNRGMNPDEVFMNDRAMETPAAPGGAPAVGTVESGYRFKGGNPADPASWEKVQ